MRATISRIAKASGLWCALLPWLVAANISQATEYQFTQLGTVDSSAYGINNAGDVVGYQYSGHYQAVIWNGTTTITLGSLAGSDSVALAINNAGEAAGTIYYADSQQAVVWNRTATPTVLGTVATFNIALGINNAGRVVGYSTPNSGNEDQAVIWNGTTPTTLGSLGGASVAYGINNAGQVVGYSTARLTSKRLFGMAVRQPFLARSAAAPV